MRHSRRESVFFASCLHVGVYPVAVDAEIIRDPELAQAELPPCSPFCLLLLGFSGTASIINKLVDNAVENG